MSERVEHIRRRLPDAPMCNYWNAEVRAARDAEPVAWCEWMYDGGLYLCTQPAVKGGRLCQGHRRGGVACAS